MQRVGAKAPGDSENRRHLDYASSGAETKTSVALRVDVVGENRAAVGERCVPLEAEVRAIDRAGELECELAVPPGVGDGAVDRAGEGDRCAIALDHERAVDRDLGAADRQRAALEAELGVVGDVEEVGGGEVRGEVLVTDIDRVGLRDAAKPLVVERRGDAGERRGERGNAHVYDRESDRGVRRVEVPRALDRRRFGDGAHVCLLLDTCLNNCCSYKQKRPSRGDIPGSGREELCDPRAVFQIDGIHRADEERRGVAGALTRDGDGFGQRPDELDGHPADDEAVGELHARPPKQTTSRATRSISSSVASSSARSSAERVPLCPQPQALHR